MSICKKCFRDLPLQQSHIIPEFFFKYVYTSDHKFTQVSTENKDSLHTEQKGWREELFCHDCEEEMSVFEKITADFFKALIESPEKLNPKEKTENYTFFDCRIDYLAIKRCLLSILWRASISSLKEYEEYDLSSSTEVELKNNIFNNTSIDVLCYPIMISKITFSGIDACDLIIPWEKGHSDLFNCDIFSFSLAGYQIDIFMDKNLRIPDPYMYNCFLNPSNLFIRNIPFETLGIKEGLIQRFKDTDVINFYNKHS